MGGEILYPLLAISGVILALGFSGLALILDVRTRKVGNLIELTREHRRLWERMASKPELARILDPDADLSSKPVTADEEMFVIFLILHLNCTWYGIRSGFFKRLEGLRRDVQQLFTLPVPRAVWERVKELQDKKFVMFIDSCLVDSR